MMDKNVYKGSTTIELAMMMPVLILVITAVINAGFYYHDKNLIYSKVYELGAIARQQERLIPGLEVKELEAHYENMIDGKLLLFREVFCEVIESRDGISITVAADKGIMSLNINRYISIDYVEQNLREMQRSELDGSEYSE